MVNLRSAESEGNFRNTHIKTERKKERKKETQQRGLRDRVNPTLVPAIRIPGPREQTYTTETRSLVGIRREGSTRAEV